MAEARSNAEIARTLREIRMLMEFAGEQFFRFMAYERAADAVDNAAPLGDLIASGELTSLPGIGKTIAGRVADIVDTGTCDYLEELRSRYPPTLMDVLGVPGVGIKTAQMLFEKYGIGSLEAFQAALDDGTLESAPRLGKKTLENMRRGILASRGRQRRWPLGLARPIAVEIQTFLAECEAVANLTVAGSMRRAEPSVGDIDFFCTSTEPDVVIARLTAFPGAQAVLAEGGTKGSIWLEGGLQIDLRVLPEHLYGNLLQHFTGSREHNIQLRELAVRKGLRVSENGILNLETGDNTTCTTEAEVYATLGLAWIPPELRSGIGEIEAARDGTLPKLIEAGDLRGDFHMHSTDSDGRDTLEAMIAACAARGYEYHAISDHSLGITPRGIDPEALRGQRARVAELGERYKIRTLLACEVDILPDGSLAFANELLAELDFVIASIHEATHLTRDEMTARLIRACENPYVNLIGHPTGRHIDGVNSNFAGYEFDFDAVFRAAARTGTALEIDGSPARLDLSGPLARKAKELGVMLACDSDAHGTGRLGDIGYAVGQARRGWIEAADVLNAGPLEGVLTFVARKRASAAASTNSRS